MDILHDMKVPPFDVGGVSVQKDMVTKQTPGSDYLARTVSERSGACSQHAKE